MYRLDISARYDTSRYVASRGHGVRARAHTTRRAEPTPVSDRLYPRHNDPAWPEQFRAEASKLAELLGPWLARPVEHIGSTSVPGLAAKPILDMMAGVHDLHSARDAIPVLTSHGYTHAQHRPATLWVPQGPD
jgi:GrpB-like predicted nucleotidyltransferase (UPF0157 family)